MDQHRWVRAFDDCFCFIMSLFDVQNEGVSRGILGLLMANLGFSALMGGVPGGDIALGTTLDLRRICAFALGSPVIHLTPLWS
jgi:hypothetical protein